MSRALFPYLTLNQAAEKLGCAEQELLELGATASTNYGLHLCVKKVLQEQVITEWKDDAGSHSASFAYGALLVVTPEDVARICCNGFADVSLLGGPYGNAGPYDQKNWNGFVFRVKGGQTVRIETSDLLMPNYEILVFEKNRPDLERQGYNFNSKWSKKAQESTTNEDVPPLAMPKASDCKTPDWIQKAYEVAKHYIGEWRKAGYEPTKQDAALHVEAVFSTEGIYGSNEKVLDRAYIERHALRGITGKRPGHKSKKPKIPSEMREYLPKSK